jgi:hypothetical protein
VIASRAGAPLLRNVCAPAVFRRGMSIEPPARLPLLPARLLLLLATWLVAVLVVLAAARPARALELGISDSDAPTVTEPLWDGLHVSRTRIVVPYDVATTPGPAGTRRRNAFEAYRASAASRGVSLFVVFGPSADIRAPDTNDPVAPTADQFAAGVAAFVQKYPDVRTIAAWNEPNNPDARSYPLGSDPQLAAEYWQRAKAACPDCTVVAGEFAGIAGNDAYVDAYQSALGGVRPDVWSFHAHGDVNAFQAGGPDSARVSRYYLGKLQGAWAGARIWIDEVGARYRDPSGVVWGDESQQDGARFLLGLATLDPRIDAIYYYNFSNQCSQPASCAIQDRGLVSPTPFNGQAPAYDAANRPRPAYRVIADRGPAITPAAPVPPVVTIDAPAQTAALPTATPAFAGQAATGGRAAPSVTLRIFPGASSTQGASPVQTASAAVVDGRWSLTAAPLPDGTYTAEASQLGNPTSSGISQDVVFTVDTVAPTSTITGGPDDPTGARTATVSFAASEPGATLACSVDRGAFTPCSSPVRLRGLAVGRHSVAVRATDAAGNVQAKPATRSWRVVSLATALAPRVGDLAAALTRGLPVAASCADACRVVARLYVPRATARRFGLAGRAVSRRDPTRPSGSGYVTVAGASVARTRAGSPALALKLRASSARAVSATSAVTLRLGVVLTARGSKPATLSRRVTLMRTGALGAVAAHGLPLTVACTSACSQRATLWIPRALVRTLHAPGRSVAGGGRSGLPRGGRYVSLGAASVARRRGGASDLTLPLPRAVRARLTALARLGVRVVGRASGPGTPARALAWPLVLPR